MRTLIFWTSKKKVKYSMQANRKLSIISVLQNILNLFVSLLAMACITIPASNGHRLAECIVQAQHTGE